MASVFPSGIDDFVDPTPSDDLDTPGVLHTDEHSNANDAIFNIETKIGADGSTDPNSIDYKLAHKQDTLITGNLSASSPLSVDATRQVIGGSAALSIQQSDATHDGYLSSSDWNKFNLSSGVSFQTDSPQDIGSASATGTSGSVPHADHVHRGVSGLFTSPNTAQYGTIALEGAGNVQVAQSSGSFTVSTSGSFVPVAHGINSASHDDFPLTPQHGGTGIINSHTLTISGDASISGTNTGDQDLSGYTPTSRTLSTSSPLSGGGDLTTNRTLSISQASSGSDGYLSSTDWNTFNGKQNALTTGNLTANSPLSLDNTRQVIGGAAAVSIADAVADGSTKGAATFNANDFNSASGVISIDYTNGQSSDANHKGFLTSTDWQTFNAKISGLTPLQTDSPANVGTLAVTGTSGSVSHADHVHQGVHGLFVTPNTSQYGDIALVGSGNITVTQSSGSFTVGSSGSFVPVIHGINSAYHDGFPLTSAHGGTGVNNGTRTLTISNNSGTINFNTASAIISVSGFSYLGPESLLGDDFFAGDSTNNTSIQIARTQKLYVAANTTINSYGFTLGNAANIQFDASDYIFTGGGSLALDGNLYTLTGGGAVALGGYTLTVPATGTAALLGTANTFTHSSGNTFNYPITLGTAAIQGGFTIPATTAGHGPNLLSTGINVFSGTNDPMQFFGYNLDYGGNRILAGDAGIALGIEGDYNDGSRRLVEMYCHVLPVTGSAFYRPFAFTVDRDNPTQYIVGQILISGTAGIFDFIRASDNTSLMSITSNGGGAVTIAGVVSIGGATTIKNSSNIFYRATGDLTDRYSMGISGSGGFQFQSRDAGTPRSFSLVSSGGASKFLVGFETGNTTISGDTTIQGTGLSSISGRLQVNGRIGIGRDPNSAFVLDAYNGISNFGRSGADGTYNEVIRLSIASLPTQYTHQINATASGGGLALNGINIALCNNTASGHVEIVRMLATGSVMVGTTTDGMTAGGSLAIAQDLAHRGTKAGFNNVTPITQPANTVAINDVLVNYGLRASGGESNFSTRTTYPGTYAAIHVHDASTAQNVATGTTYSKITAFTDNGFSNNCTPDAANDKITITKAGLYRVVGSVSFADDTNNVTWFASAFLNGVEQDQIHFTRKIGTAGDVGNAALTGIIDVTTVPWDLDLRMRHDAAGTVAITVSYANLNIEYVGET